MKRSQKLAGQIDKLNASIGANVKEIRKEAKVRQAELAKVLGLDQSAVSRVEAGKQALTAAQWVLFCNRFGITECCLVEWVN